jgi:hypothetical protein
MMVRYANLTSSNDPYNVHEDLSNPKWKAGMDDEYAALMRNKTWSLVPPQLAQNVIDYKWVYKSFICSIGTYFFRCVWSYY